MTNNIKIACMSDLHGVLPDITGLEVDLAIIAGDICPETSPVQQAVWIENYYIPWIKHFPCATWIAGNHDYVYELFHHPTPYPHLYLCNEINESILPDIKIFGTPYSLPFGRYVFMENEEGIARQLQLIETAKPQIIISHGPPYGYGDIGYQNLRAGSHSLSQFIEKNQPPLTIVGHIHEGYGTYRCGQALIVNAALTNYNTWNLRKPIIVEIYIQNNKCIEATIAGQSVERFDSGPVLS